MSQQKSLRVTNDVFAEFNALKVRVAVSDSNRIPNVSKLVNALIAIGNVHYDELLANLANLTEGNETQ